jgi:hypothetical protein
MAMARDIPTTTDDMAYVMYVLGMHTTRALMAETIAKYIQFKLMLQYELLTGEKVLEEGDVEYEATNL